MGTAASNAEGAHERSAEKNGTWDRGECVLWYKPNPVSSFCCLVCLVFSLCYRNNLLCVDCSIAGWDSCSVLIIPASGLLQ